MRSLLIITLLVFCFEASAQSTVKENALKGPVRSVLFEITRVFPEIGQPYDEAITSAEKHSNTFDKQGRLSEEAFFDSAGKTRSRTTHEYADDGSEVETTFGSDGNVEEKLIIKRKRDSEGRVIEVMVFKDDGSLRNRIVGSYESQGQVFEESNFKPDGSLLNRSIVAYDDSGKIREFNLYNSAGVVIQREATAGDINEVTLRNAGNGSVQRILRNRPVVEAVDTHGNWTRQKTAMTKTEPGRSEEGFVVVNRTITYY
jgi:hypothetical protein